ncbi:hypothetical protein EKI60_06615 [Candidatus Saccharibacteria bacterium]|nr:MAG: hypothetical protein EKI60_06615 [Candidatus Saccharibacteria bacterium]
MPKCPKCQYEWVTKQRSNQQNRYWRGVVVPMVAEAMGESNHDYVADEIKKIPEVSGVMRHYCSNKDDKAYRIRSTTELSTAEWEVFMSSVRMWASKFYSIFIPEPNESVQEPK